MRGTTVKAKKNLVLLSCLIEAKNKSGMSAYEIATQIGSEFCETPAQLETYRRHFRSGLDPNGKDVFAHWEVIRMMQITNQFEPFFQLCDLLGFDRPERINRVDEQARIMSLMEAREEEMKELTAKLAAIKNSNQVVLNPVSRFLLN